MKTKMRVIDYVFIALAVLLFLFMVIYGCVKLPSLPDELPSHFNFAGEVDGWSGKTGAISAPMVIGFLVLVIMGPILFFPKVWNNTQGVPEYKLPRVIRSTRTGMSFMLFLTEAFFCYTLVRAVHGAPLHAFVSPLYMTLMFLDIVFILVQTFRK